MSIPTLLGRMGRLAEDWRGDHEEEVKSVTRRFKLRSTAATVVLCPIPGYAVVDPALATVIDAFDNSPTLVIGTYDQTGTVDNADALVESGEINLAVAGSYYVAAHAGQLATAPRLLVATFAAGTAPTTGEVIVKVSWSRPDRNGAETI